MRRFPKFNKLIIQNPYPFLLIDEVLAKTNDSDWFSTVDINSAFCTISVHIKDRYKTGFVIMNGHWQWPCLPFGLKRPLQQYFGAF